MGKGLASIFEKIFAIIGKVFLTGLFIIAKTLESIFSGLTEYLNKRIKQ